MQIRYSTKRSRSTKHTKKQPGPYNNRNQQQNNTQQTNTRRVRNIQAVPHDNPIQEEETETETIDPESTCYMREMIEDWSSINFIESLNFTTVTQKDLNKNHQGEFWIQTSSKNENINWLADKGGPRSFISRSTAQNLIGKIRKQDY